MTLGHAMMEVKNLIIGLYGYRASWYNPGTAQAATGCRHWLCRCLVPWGDAERAEPLGDGADQRRASLRPTPSG